MKYLFLIALFIQFNANAQNSYFVSLTGSAGNSGTITSPFRKISQAANVAQPGDFIYVRAGVYRNTNFNDGDIWNNESTESITCNGAANNYISIMPYNAEQVTIEFDASYAVIISNSSYVTFQNFTIKGINEQITYTEADNAWGLYKEGGIIKTIVGNTNLLPLPAGIQKPTYYNGRGLVANSSHHINLYNNIVYNCPSSGIRVQQSDYVNVKGNTVYNNTFWTTQGVGAITAAESTNIDNVDDYKIIFENNLVRDNENKLISWNPNKTFITYVIDEGSGIFLTRNENTYLAGKFKISNNISYNNGASGIMCHFTNRTLINNNTVYHNGANNDGQPGGIGYNNANDVVLANNIIQSRTNKWAIGAAAQPNTNITAISNIVFNNNGSVAVNNNISTGFSTANPLFVNPTAFNFGLQSSSPAINNAASAYAEPKDFFNVTRTTADIGAIEFQSVLAIPMQYCYLQNLPNKTVVLNWKSMLFNNGTFTIERSINGINWEKINAPILGNNDIYNAIDNSPISGKSYYRVVHTNTSGKKDYSTILVSNFGKVDDEISVFPNPTAELLIVKANSIKSLQMFTAEGKQIALPRTLRSGANAITLNLSNFSSGIYYISVNGNMQKIVKR
jgi:parallel beta-helix repeat protein